MKAFNRKLRVSASLREFYRGFSRKARGVKLKILLIRGPIRVIRGPIRVIREPIRGKKRVRNPRTLYT